LTRGVFTLPGFIKEYLKFRLANCTETLEESADETIGLYPNGCIWLSYIRNAAQLIMRPVTAPEAIDADVGCSLCDGAWLAAVQLVTCWIRPASSSPQRLLHTQPCMHHGILHWY